MLIFCLYFTHSASIFPQINRNLQILEDPRKLVEQNRKKMKIRDLVSQPELKYVFESLIEIHKKTAFWESIILDIESFQIIANKTCKERDIRDKDAIVLVNVLISLAIAIEMHKHSWAGRSVCAAVKSCL